MKGAKEQIYYVIPIFHVRSLCLLKQYSFEILFKSKHWLFWHKWETSLSQSHEKAVYKRNGSWHSHTLKSWKCLDLCQLSSGVWWIRMTRGVFLCSNKKMKLAQMTSIFNAFSTGQFICFTWACDITNWTWRTGKMWHDLMSNSFSSETEGKVQVLCSFHEAMNPSCQQDTMSADGFSILMYNVFMCHWFATLVYLNILLTSTAFWSFAFIHRVHVCQKWWVIQARNVLC